MLPAQFSTEMLRQIIRNKYVIGFFTVNFVIVYYIFKFLAKWDPLFSKKDVDTLFSKLPGDGTQAPTDFGRNKGVQVRLSR